MASLEELRLLKVAAGEREGGGEKDTAGEVGDGEDQGVLGEGPSAPRRSGGGGREGSRDAFYTKNISNGCRDGRTKRDATSGGRGEGHTTATVISNNGGCVTG